MNAFIFLVLLCFAISRRESPEKVVTLILYALFVYLPGIVTTILIEVKGPQTLWRRLVMLSACYTVLAAAAMNVFVLGYVLVYAECKDMHSARKRDKCKSEQGGKITVCLIFMII